MGREIEKKYRLGEGDADAVERRLRRFGARFLGENEEVNLIYSSPDLSSSNSVIRVRKSPGGSTLTFKRFVSGDSGLKEHVELESDVGDPEALSAILEQLGLELKIVYEKRRKTWELGDVEVVIDELPFGWFLEIEGSEGSIRRSESALGADRLEPEPDTYPALTFRLGVNEGGIMASRFAK